MKSFAPGVVINGKTVYPPGWVWQLSFALAGCEWAIKRCETNEWREGVRKYYTDQRNTEIERTIAYYENELIRLKKDLLIS